MLSRVALAPRLGLMAAQLSRGAASPAIRARSVAISATSWSRAFASKNSRSGPTDNKKQQPSSTPSSQPKSNSKPPAGSQKGGKAAAGAGEESVDAAKEPETIPFHELPDLTQGIPSTLDQELRKQSGRSDSALEAVEQEESDRGRREREEYVSSSDRNRKWWARFMMLATAAGGSFGILYMGRDWDDTIEAERHPEAPNGWGPNLWWQRVRARMGESVSYYQDPAFDKLLPDPDPTFERPYTLCLSLDDLLVHSEWSREHGWRVAKRPGMDYFVRYLSQYYELVLFTAVPFAMGEPIVRKLDPFRFIMWPLYREATKYEDGAIVKVSYTSATSFLLY